MTVFLGIASGAIGAYMIAGDHAETIAQIEQGTRSTARLLEEHAKRTFDSADLVAARLGDRLGAADAKVAALDMLKGAPYLATLLLLDRNGHVVLDARGDSRPGSGFADWDWVKDLKAASGPATVLGITTLDEVPSTRVFAAARRVETPTGRFAGVAVAMVDPAYFTRFYQSLPGQLAPTLGIASLDGSILVQEPSAAPPPDLSSVLKHDISEATFRAERSEFGTWVVSTRTLPTRGMVVWVGVPEDRALAAWRMRSWWIGGLILAGLMVMAGLTSVLLRGMAHQDRAARSLEVINRDLKQSNADLEQFAYVASHDLKEPLRNISGYVQLLQRRYEGRLDADADAFIGYTVDGVRRMQAIIHGLLAYSRIGTGSLAVEETLSGAAVSAALAQLKTVISEAQAAVEIKGPLPLVRADPAQLISLFQNIIGNGLKYRRKDVRPEITVGVEDRGAAWEFYVRDNGIGIESQYHRQIFDLFKRLHARDDYGGTGIGLAACKRVVERHGGQIWLDSEPGRGSTFRFSLPKSGPPDGG